MVGNSTAMSYMSDRVFIDTNILVYAYTLGDPTKHKACKEIMKNVFAGDMDAVVSNQVIGELSKALLTKFDSPFAEVEEVIEDLVLYDDLDKIDYTSKTVRLALVNCKMYGVPFWDSVIAQTMKENGISEILTENQKDFGKIPWIKVRRPFNK